MIDIKQLRNYRLQYQDIKGEYGDVCKEIIETAKFLGCDQGGPKEDVRISLAFIEGMLSGLGIGFFVAPATGA